MTFFAGRTALLTLTAALVWAGERDAHASVREVTGDEQPTPDPWPQAVADRPLALPPGYGVVSVVASYFRPAETPDRATFHASQDLGFGAAFGLPDGFELGISVPRAVCLASKDPSLCDAHNRWSGAGVGLGWAPLGPGVAQASVSTGLALAGGEPHYWRFHLGVEGKLRPLSWVVLMAWGELTRGYEVPSAAEREVTDRFYVGGLLGWQPLRPLFISISSSLSFNDTTSRLTSLAASWTFGNRLEVGAWSSWRAVPNVRSPLVPGTTWGASFSVPWH